MSFRRRAIRLALLIGLLAMSGCHSGEYWFPDPEATVACTRNDNLIQSLEGPDQEHPGDITVDDAAEHIASLAPYIRRAELKARVAAVANFRDAEDIAHRAADLRKECREANPMKFEDYAWDHFWLIWLSLVLVVAPLFLFFKWIQIHRIERRFFP